MPRIRITIGLVATIALAVVTPTGQAQMHQDPAYGYEIRPPSDFQPTEKNTSSPWVIARFRSKKEYFQNDEQGWTWGDYPEMTVVAFVHEAVKAADAEAGAELDAEGNPRKITLTLRTPYRDYKDYLKRSYSGGGYYFAKEESGEVDGIPYDEYDIKVEKGSYRGPQRISTWVYHLADVDIAVQFECIEKAYDKIRNDLGKCFRSFGVIERTEPLPTGETVHEIEDIVSRTEWDQLLPEERAELRRDLEQKAHEKAANELPKGWRKFNVGRILVLDSTDPKLAKEIAQRCEAILDWLDENFYFVGPGEYVRAPILKVSRAQDDNPFTIFFGSSLDDIEIKYEHDPNWVGLWDYGQDSVNRRVFELWFKDRDQDLRWAMPPWVEYGLLDLVANSRNKGKKLVWALDRYDTAQLTIAANNETLTSAQDLMRLDSTGFLSGGWKSDEASALVRFLIIGAGAKSKATKDVFWKYIQNLQIVSQEIREEELAAKDADKAKPTTEEEEDAWFKERQTGWKNKERRILDEVFQRTFVGWDDKDWKSFEKAYLRSIDD